MCDYIDDFDDDYGEFEDDGFMEDDFEDTYGEHLDDCEPDDSMDDELEPEIDKELIDDVVVAVITSTEGRCVATIK